MEIKISSKHMDLTPAIEEYATKKVEKFPRFFDRIHTIEVVVDRAKIGYVVEIINHVAHHDPIVATAEAEDLYACVDLGIDRAIRQLKDHKSRVRDHKHHTPAGGRKHETS